jgi:hypothetical protein
MEVQRLRRNALSPIHLDVVVRKAMYEGKVLSSLRESIGSRAEDAEVGGGDGDYVGSSAVRGKAALVRRDRPHRRLIGPSTAKSKCGHVKG